MKRILLIASVTACLALFSFRASSQLQATRLYGVYTAVVVNTQDPSQRGRVLVRIPASPTAEAWAQQSVPYSESASPRVPPPNTEVWVAFEAGEPSRPVLIGVKPRLSSQPAP